MDRTEYLQLCQKVSMLKSGICGIKQNVPPELLVKHNEIVYYPVFGERELDAEIFNNIEQGSIPLITEGFYDGLDNIETFTELYGSDAYKWIIYNGVE